LACAGGFCFGKEKPARSLIMRESIFYFSLKLPANSPTRNIMLATNIVRCNEAAIDPHLPQKYFGPAIDKRKNMVIIFALLLQQ